VCALWSGDANEKLLVRDIVDIAINVTRPKDRWNFSQ
jgi:hypothetical protein